MPSLASDERCPDCGTPIVSEPGIPGLCPQCIFSMALRRPEPAPDDAETLDRPAAGRILGERYQVRELLGRGGMGEVFRAFDLKLRVDVALKAARFERAGSERGREMLRREVRSAREVVSPNVCRIFDLVVEEGQELVSMEYIDGDTLAQRLRERGPLAMEEAREIASQFLSGLEAIHQAGFVHRDFKPENVMITRAGRVVVMDFGLAKVPTERSTTISGTPAYMAPEQARGEGVDTRADVFAAGMVLSEMVGAGGEAYDEVRQELWRALREVPPRVPEGPWATVLCRALAPSPQARYSSARALARALEEVTERLPGVEEKRPYPGLASFTEEDAAFFFGREVEVEALWRKLKRPRLLALIGPSGAGKSSFLRAGLVPTLPPAWRAVFATPGSRPFQSLAQALVPEFAGDTEGLQALLRLEDADTAVFLFRRLRQRAEQALLVVDQFEELFTLNTAEVQEAFASLLGRLVLDADLHVILSLRDDFLIRCHAYESLAPAFGDLTPLGPLGEGSLRRALVQPALACGYRFEDEALVDEMVQEVGPERGALPLLAFAASRLWERRDRDRGLLTRAAYREIGGVAGALAHHAEATLERIGAPRIPLVREVLRNLVTAQGTRSVLERRELLSVFAREEDPKASREAEAVLDALVDARLLTSYERLAESGASHPHVEIIHESLLTAWPRLVRWQTQDADGAVLRDQLRQAAQLWQDRGRSEDLLWSGTAYREFALWKERYPGALSKNEEAFTEAAARLAGRRRRRRRLAVGVVIALLLAVTTAVTVSRQRAIAETRRAEAAKLVALGQLQLGSYPTAGLAYALKSLEIADTDAGRLLALRVLQRGPVALLTPLKSAGPAGHVVAPAFSPNGEWLALGTFKDATVLRRDGSRVLVLGDLPESAAPVVVGFSPGSDALAAVKLGEVRVWSVPEGRELRRGRFETGPSWLWPAAEGFVTVVRTPPREVLRWWPFDKGEPRPLGDMESGRPFDVRQGSVAFAQGRTIYLRSLQDWSVPPRPLGEHPAEVYALAFSPDGDRVVASDRSGEVRIWPAAAPARRPLQVLRGGKVDRLSFDARGRRLAGYRSDPTQWMLWDLRAPAGTEPWLLQRSDATGDGMLAFDPSGEWLVTAHYNDAALWWLGESLPRVLAGHRAGVTSVAFTPDGKALVSASFDDTVHVWPLEAQGDQQGHDLLPAQGPGHAALYVDAPSRHVITQSLVGVSSKILAVPLSGEPPRELLRCESYCFALAQGDEGRLVAAAPSELGAPEGRWIIQVLEVESGTVQKVEPPPALLSGARLPFAHLQFLGARKLLASQPDTGLFLFDLSDGTSRLLAPQPKGRFALSHDGRFVLGLTTAVAGLDDDPGLARELVRLDLDTGREQTLRSHGTHLSAVALDPSDTMVATGSVDGTVSIGTVLGGEPHLFLRHEGQVWWVAFSPDGRWLASAGHDGKIVLWPVPDLSQPQLQRRSYLELVTTLRSRTNLRVVPDLASPTGWKLGRDPFPGWSLPPAR